MDSKILGISGKKQSGKSSCSAFLHAVVMNNIVITDADGAESPLVDNVRLNESGKIVVPADIDGEIQDAILELENDSHDFKYWMEEHVWKFIRQIHIAGRVKDACVKLFRLSPECVYGSDEDKNIPTGYTWGSLPGRLPKGKSKDDYITHRDFMKWLGNSCRGLDPNIHIKNISDEIAESNPERVIVPDIRFVNEVEAIRNLGGLVVRLTRTIDDSDLDVSEVELDGYTDFDLVIDNQNLSMEETHKILFDWLAERDWF